MFIFGHIGLTIGILVIGLILFKKPELISKIDFRIIAVFAILPDILDKTLGYLIFPDQLHSGRLFSHTLVFLIFFMIVYFLIIGSQWWVYSFPIITHQLFDQPWLDPGTWLWPAFGWGFKYSDISPWESWFSALTSNPFIITTELLGIIALITVFVGFKLYTKKRFVNIVKTGKISNPNEKQ